MQEELKTRTVEASVGGGAVTVVMNGEKMIESLKLNPQQLILKMWKCLKICNGCC